MGGKPWEKCHWSNIFFFLVVIPVLGLPLHDEVEQLTGDAPDSMGHSLNLKTSWGCP